MSAVATPGDSSSRSRRTEPHGRWWPSFAAASKPTASPSSSPRPRTQKSPQDERASEGSGVGMGSGETPDGLVSKAGGFSKAGGCSKAGFLHFPSTFPTSKYKKRRCIVIRLLDSQITPDRSFNELKAIGALPPTGPKRDRKTHS